MHVTIVLFRRRVNNHRLMLTVQCEREWTIMEEKKNQWKKNGRETLSSTIWTRKRRLPRFQRKAHNAKKIIYTNISIIALVPFMTLAKRLKSLA